MSTQPDWHKKPTVTGYWYIEWVGYVAYIVLDGNPSDKFQGWYYGPIPPKPSQKAPDAT